MYYIGLDVHKRKISYCVKDSGGKLHSEGSIPATRFDLDRWMKTLPQPWSAAMQAGKVRSGTDMDGLPVYQDSPISSELRTTWVQGQLFV